ncbi:hypothetical protein [Deinococcus xianganensis]|uniref:Uncharacterized protein n=1 Tax=Deinococcus xianganensis TaxID=1507289 RepID=A0A6I4YW92_9DEIO|nr:hypothetical protein [Deinococcus xianganensis]MXV21915.1 hypothetical protein [Deinococcus xianganensis]
MRAGQLAIAAFAAYAVLYLTAPDARPILDAMTPWGMFGIIFSSLAGVILRVWSELLSGERLYWYRWRPWHELAWALGCAAVAAWMMQRVLSAVPDVAPAGWAMVWQPLLQLAGAALIVLAARAGYEDGDDHTWRARHGLG